MTLPKRYDVGDVLTLPLLRHVRERAPLSQEELAERSGVHRVTIARLELGATARASTIRKLAKALGVKPAALYGEDGGVTTPCLTSPV